MKSLKEVSLVTRTWSLEEKRALLLALQKHGASDLESIHAAIPNKSIFEIRYILDVYAKRSYNKLQQIDKIHDEEYPLNAWTKVMKASKKRKNVVGDAMARLLKYIALFEKQTPSDINLRDCYMVLHDMCKGVPPKEMDEKTSYFFYQRLTNLAAHVQYCDEEREFVKTINIDCAKPEAATYGRKKLSKQTNPFDIPDHMLKDEKK